MTRETSKGKSRRRGKNTILFPMKELGDLPSSSKPLSDTIPKPVVENANSRALRRMGITNKALSRCAEISPMLDRCFASEKSGTGTASNKRVISYLRFSEDPAIKAIVATYDRASTCDRDNVPFEALCIKAKVNPVTVLGAAILSARNLSAQESALTTIIEHPEVVRQTLFFAKTLAGATKDREMAHQAVGWLPTAKGISMNVNLMGGNPQLASAEQNEDDDDDEAFNKAFPSLNGKIEDWNTSRQKLLERGR